MSIRVVLVLSSVALLATSKAAANPDTEVPWEALACPFVPHPPGESPPLQAGLIVTLADWHEPLLAYTAARALGAIASALTESGFRLADQDDAQREEGGVARLVFHRWKNKSRQDLALYLVPETPELGVDPERFRRAINCLPDPGDVRVVGPTYSGSAWSLRAALRKVDSRTVRIITGSATSESAAQILSKASPDAGAFARTVRGNLALAKALKDYLDQYDHGRMAPGQRSMALLVEQSTEYGRDLRDSFGDAGVTALVLPFPIHIAEASGATDGGSTSSTAIAGESRAVALDRLLSTISMDGYEYVGIVASDVRDRLFLQQRIHASAPDVRVIFFEGDLLYATSVASRGAIVVSSYPLLNDNQLWTDAKAGGVRFQFESDPAQGVHNATLAMLSEMDEPFRTGVAPLVEYRPPFSPDASDAGQPPVWVSVQGVRQAWPVRQSPGADDPFLWREQQAAAQPELTDVPELFHILGTLLAVGLLLVTGWLLSGPHKAELEQRGSGLPLLVCPIESTESCRALPGRDGTPQWGAGRLSRCGYALVFFGWTVLLCHVLKLLVWSGPGSFETDAGHLGAVVLVALGAGAALVCTIASVVGIAARDVVGTRTLAALGAHPVQLAAASVGIVVLLRAALRECALRGSDFELFRQRTVHLASGVSPIPAATLFLLFASLGAASLSAYSASQTAYGRLRIWESTNRSPREWFRVVLDARGPTLVAWLLGFLIAVFMHVQLVAPLEPGPFVRLVCVTVDAGTGAIVVFAALAAIRWAMLRSALGTLESASSTQRLPALLAKGADGSVQLERDSSRIVSAAMAFLTLLPGPRPEPAAARLRRAIRDEIGLVQRLLVLPLAGTPLLMLAISSYPFEPRRLMLLVLTVLLTGVVVLALTIAVALERDPLVRAVEQRERWFALEPAFLVRVVGLAAPLIFALLGTQVPEFGTSILRALEDGFRVIK